MKRKKALKSKVIKHLKGDIKSFKKEASEDRELIKSLKDKPKKKHDPKPRRKMAKGQIKIKKVMNEFKEGVLYSGSKKGPQVKSRKQAIAIALSEARKAGAHIQPKKRK